MANAATARMTTNSPTRMIIAIIPIAIMNLSLSFLILEHI
jgi:hypothetical protein